MSSFGLLPPPPKGDDVIYVQPLRLSVVSALLKSEYSQIQILGIQIFLKFYAWRKITEITKFYSL